MNFCNNGGYLVDANYWLPDDPFDYFRASFGVGVAGCNSIVCNNCKQSVQHTRESTARRYTCACETYVTLGAFHLDTSSDSDPDPLPLWRCAGHPIFVPPGLIAGSFVDSILGWSPIVAAHIETKTNLHPSIDRITGFTMTRIFQALGSEADQQELGRAVGRRGNDPSLRVRQAVAMFFVLNRKVQGLELVLRAWQDAPESYDNYPAALGPNVSLKDNLLEAIAARIIGGVLKSEALLAIWRWAALRGAGLGPNLYSVKYFDAVWADEHLEQMFELAPVDWYTIIRTIHVKFPMRLEPGCRRAIAEGHATYEQVAAALFEKYSVDAEPVIATLQR